MKQYIFIILLCLFIHQCQSIGDNSKNNINATKKVKDVKCEFCKVVIGYIRHEITVANDTVHEIEDIVKLLCDTLGIGPIKAECNMILDDIDEIVNWILDGLLPKDICQKLDMCKKKIK